VRVGYPDAEHERAILQLVRNEARNKDRLLAEAGSQLAPSTVLTARQQVLAVHVADNVEDYMVRLIGATRDPGRYDERLVRWLAWGASPRGTLALDGCSRARAWLAGRDYVSPDDVQAVAHDCLRHRLLLSYEAEAEAISVDDVIDALLARVAVP
jgi:MoxR-like ATPase